MEVLRQGCFASAILTNHSKYITIINPRSKNVSTNQPSPKKGNRLMFRTTLTFEENPWVDCYRSSTREVCVFYIFF